MPRVFLTLTPAHNHDDDDDEIAYFAVRCKTRELVLSTAPSSSSSSFVITP